MPLTQNIPYAKTTLFWGGIFCYPTQAKPREVETSEASESVFPPPYLRAIVILLRYLIFQHTQSLPIKKTLFKQELIFSLKKGNSGMMLLLHG